MNISIEDYLRTLYNIYENLEDKNQGIRSVDLAQELNISKPSVSAMLRKLQKLSYIHLEPYSKIQLTQKGKQEAKRIMHNHRVIEVFLKQTLGYKDPKILHEEAHKLEHAFSEETIKRLDTYLKNPKTSPTGHIIPH